MSLLRKQFSTCWTIGARVIEDDVEERGDEDVKHVETLHREVMWRVTVGQSERVRCTRRHGACRVREREFFLDKAVTLGMLRLTAWIFIIFIFWTQLFHCKLFFYFFYFFTKIRDFFFSTNRDLDNLIWTQKKNQIFHSLNLIISFSCEVLVFI